MFSVRLERHLIHSAASSPVQILLSYKLYFSRTEVGDKLGITTLAPALIPSSRPFSAMVPSAVVAEVKASGTLGVRY